MSAFDEFIAQGLQAVRDFTAKTITYKRGSAWVELPATKGSSKFQAEDADGVTYEHTSTDFIFATDDLRLNDQPAEPKDNDLIIAGGNTYQVLRQPGVKSWNYSDSGRSTIRVRTKEKS